MRNYKLEILGLSETRWTGFGEIQVDDITFIYSGKEENEEHAEGVGLLLSKNAKKSLLEWKPISSRIIHARFKSNVRNISLIQCYAPTEDADSENKDQFYSLLTSTVLKVPKQDILIVMGDMNSKVGADNTQFEAVMGKHGLGERNENGEYLIEFCLQNNLIIGGTFFPHKSIHKATWYSPDGVTRNQIDHFAIARRWRKSLLDVCVKRGADVNSDHNLVLAVIQLKVCSVRRVSSFNQRFNTMAMANRNVKAQFKLELNNKFAKLSEIEENNSDNPQVRIEQRWSRIKAAYTETCKEILGYKKQGRKPWMSDCSWDLVKQRKQLRLLMLQEQFPERISTYKDELRNMQKKVKKSIRSDKRKFVKELAEEAQKAAEINDSRTLYRITKTLSKKNFNRNVPLRTEEGEIIADTHKQLEHWKKHFENILGGNGNIVSEENVVAGETHNDISTKTPSLSEIKSAISAMKDWKAPGIDMIDSNILKCDIDLSAKELYPLIKDIWEHEILPEEWTTGVLIKLPKKGKLSNCDNWRGIMLLTIASKILTYIILRRLEPIVESTIRTEQSGFRAQRSCTDNINSLRIIIEQTIEFRSNLYITFVDFAKAFDKISRNAIWDALRRRHVPNKLINLIKAAYKDFSCKVSHQGLMSEPIRVNQGVRQGCILSPLLFLITLDDVMDTVKSSNPQAGIQWKINERLCDIDYADDIALLSHQRQDMAQLLTSLNNAGQRVGLRINMSKTEEMRVNCTNMTPITIDSKPVKRTDKFCYLGSIITEKGGTHEDVNYRLSKAKAAFSTLIAIWKDKNLATTTKIRIFKTNVLSVLLYGSESWLTTKVLDNKLQCFVNRCLRYILRIFWPDTISNINLWKKTEMEPVSCLIRKRKWGWIGHVLRRNDIPRVAIEWNPQGSRRRGRPNMTWRKTVDKEVKRTGLSWNELKTKAHNRSSWRSIVSALCSQRE